MSVKMFTEHCRAAISMVSPLEMPYLTKLIRTKIIGEARVHIQDRIGMRLDDMLKTLELICNAPAFLCDLLNSVPPDASV